jgi:pre-mRNA-splicing helicase BRR2
MLVCAPTGAGKTFIAVMTMLNIINKFRDSNTGKIDKSAFKIIYIAPMKALVAEMVGGFTQLLDPLGLEVRELTGDVNMSKYEMERT